MSNILIGSVPFNSGFSNGFQTSPLDISFIEISVQNADIFSSAVISVDKNNIELITYIPTIININNVNVNKTDINININDPYIISINNVNVNKTDINININDPYIININNVNVNKTDINININDPYIINECLNIDNPFFDMDSECKQKEGKLYDNLLVGAINQIGVDSNWYVTDYSTNNDKTFGEDNDRLIKRKFYIKYMTDELPKDVRVFDGHGISGMDVFHIYIPKQSFAQMSQLNTLKQIAYPSYKPQPGDIIQSLHNNIFYEVIEVKDKIELFLQRTHSWDITLRPNINKHYNVSLNLITDPINDAIPDEDILSQNNLINNIKSDVLFDDMQNFNPFNL